MQHEVALEGLYALSSSPKAQSPAQRCRPPHSSRSTAPAPAARSTQEQGALEGVCYKPRHQQEQCKQHLAVQGSMDR